MRWLYHAKLDPYNTTEFMDWTWSDLILDWTNGTGNIYVHVSLNPGEGPPILGHGTVAPW